MSKNIFLMEGALLGAIANNAVRQSPYHRPDNLEIVLDKYHQIVGGRFSKAPMNVLELTNQQLKDMVRELGQIKEYTAWNERKNGNQSHYSFSSRYDSPAPDNDFIDLDALEGNILNQCVNED